MQAAYNAAEGKVSYKIAKKIAAQYHDSVKITQPGFFARPLVMPAFVVAAAVALVLGLVYPSVWSGWITQQYNFIWSDRENNSTSQAG